MAVTLTLVSVRVDTMEKQTIQKLLDAKSPRLRFEPYEGGKSKVWASFVVVTVDGSQVPFVKCYNCTTLLRHM